MKQVRAVYERSRASVLGIASAWIKSDDELIDVYVRVQCKSYGGLAYTCFTVANVTVVEACQNKGVFTEWLSKLEQELKGTDVKMIMVESILDKRFSMFLKRQGYQEFMHGTEDDVFKFI